MPKKKQLTKERSTKVRPGWQRFTTYYTTQNIEYIKTEADKQNVYVMDLLAEIISEYKIRHKGTGDTY